MLKLIEMVPANAWFIVAMVVVVVTAFMLSWFKFLKYAGLINGITLTLVGVVHLILLACGIITISWGIAAVSLLLGISDTGYTIYELRKEKREGIEIQG